MSLKVGVDDFKLVSYKRKASKDNKSIHCLLKQLNLSSETDQEVAIRRIKTAKQDLLTSDIYGSFKASLREGLQVLSKSKIVEIVCFGLGRIGECVISRYQLALLLCLKDLYNASAFVYDPVFSDVDISILKSFGIEILTRNTEGKYSVKSNTTTLFFLPHCPKQLCNNLLWANWGLQLNNCILICNSFASIIESTPKRKLLRNYDLILSISPFVLELAVINSFKYYDVFNDTAIHVFPIDNLSLISKDFWSSYSEPDYSDEDLEFVKSK